MKDKTVPKRMRFLVSVIFEPATSARIPCQMFVLDPVEVPLLAVVLDIPGKKKKEEEGRKC